MITPEQADQLCKYYNVDATEDYEICELLDKLMSPMIVIKTPQGKVYADEGDYIVKDAESQVHLCKPSAFNAIYEKVDAE